MVIKINRRGFFFTMMAIVVLSLFVVSYTFYSQIQERKSIEKRITTMNSFLDSTEKDLSRQLYVSGYRIIFLYERKIVNESGTPILTDFDAQFNKSFIEGTIYNKPDDLMTDYNFSSILSSLKASASELNIDIDLYNESVQVTQDNPWQLKIILNYTLFMSDKSNLASWHRIGSTVAYIPITNFIDPLYLYNTNGKMLMNITKTPYSIFDPLNSANLTFEYTNGYYINSTNAPSFLNRLKNNMSADPNGIESLVNLARLSASGANAILGRSAVDYEYFSSVPSTQTLAGIPFADSCVYKTICA